MTLPSHTPATRRDGQRGLATRVATPFAWAGALACLALLAGCGSFGGSSGKPAADVAKRGGGYYLDDGPGPNPPANLDEVPDAVPRAEALHRGAARPYVIMGRSYAPMTALASYRERGMATWYGRRYHGKRTSSGEVYDMYAMTAAHTVLPIPSYARVTNLANGRSVVVRINDRGPFLGERLIDLSYVAAHKLDIVRNGSALVEVETVFAGSDAPLPATMTASTTAGTREPPAMAAIPPETRVQPVAAEPRAPTAEGQHYLQLGAFAVRANAERFLDQARALLGSADASLDITASGDLFRVQAGPYGSRSAALQAAERIAQLLGSAPVLAAPR